MFSISPVSLSSPAYRSSNTSRSNVAFAGRQLSQEEIDKYRQAIGITDPIRPEDTSKTEANSAYYAQAGSLVGIPGAIYKRIKGMNTFNALQNKIERSPVSVLGLDKYVFAKSELAQKYADKNQWEIILSLSNCLPFARKQKGINLYD